MAPILSRPQCVKKPLCNIEPGFIFLSLAQSNLRLYSANHRPCYWSNLHCDWPSPAWAYSEQETENKPWAPSQYPKRRDLVKSRSHEIGTLNCRITLKFDRHIGSTAAEVPVKFQSDRTILNTNLAALRLHEILRKDVFSDIETGPWSLVSCWSVMVHDYW